MQIPLFSPTFIFTSPFLPLFPLSSFSPLTFAIPSGSLIPLEFRDPNPLAHPFRGSTLALPPRQSPAEAFALLRRQGCPNLTLLCPNGVCCPYGNDCCGGSCCESGYVCSGGTSAAPCCVAIGDLTSVCGGGGEGSNPCTRPGDLPCIGVNICCPPASFCYYDAAGYPRCEPQSGSGTGGGTDSSVGSDTGTGSDVGSDTDVDSDTTTTSTTSTTYSSPTPTPTSSSSSSSTPTASPDPDPPFRDTGNGSIWTPAMIGGVAGGSAAGVILLSLFLWWCIRRCCQSDSSDDTIYNYRDYQTPPRPRVQRLTDDQIYSQVYGVASPNDWQNIYTAEAKRIPRDDNIDPVPWMEDFASRAVSLRIAQIRNGDKRKEKLVKGGFMGAVPFANTIASFFGYDNTKTFRNFSIDCLGLGDSEQTARLRAQAKEVTRTKWMTKMAHGAEWVGEKAVEHWWNNSDFAAAVKEQMMQDIANEFGAQAAQELAGQIVHVKLVFGQIAGATRGVITVDRKMSRALEWLQPVALRFHREVFVVNALSEAWGEEY
ncbi:hypothetical protein V8F20_011950 [Naviculisporaceae sp. PSN 640]